MRNPKKKRAYAWIANTSESDVQKQIDYCKLWGVSNEIHVVELFIDKEPQDYLKRHSGDSVFDRACLSAWLRAVCAVKDTYALVPRYKDLSDVCSNKQWAVLRLLLETNRSHLVSATDTYEQMPSREAPPEEFAEGLALGAQIGKYTPTFKAPPQLAPTSDKKLKAKFEKTRRCLANLIAFMAYEQKLALVTIHFECIRLNITLPGEVAVLSENDISAVLRHYSRLKPNQQYKRAQSLPVLLRKFHSNLRAYEELAPLTEAQKERAAQYAGGKDPNGYTIADTQYRYHMRSNNLRQRKRGGRRKKEKEQPKVVS